MATLAGTAKSYLKSEDWQIVKVEIDGRHETYTSCPLALRPELDIHIDVYLSHICFQSAFSRFTLCYIDAHLLQIPSCFSEGSHLIFFDLHLMQDVFGRFLPGNCRRVRFGFGSESPRGSSGDSVVDTSFCSLDPSIWNASRSSFGVSATEV